MRVSDELLDLIGDEYVHEILRFHHKPPMTFEQYLVMKLKEMGYSNG